MPCMDVPSEGDPLSCEVGGGGYFLPLGGDAEQQWDRGLRAALYLAGLLWCFVGVAIIADVFMSAIDKVTSKKIHMYDKKIEKWRTKMFWNPTVANLTLMALGSSAPEILLNVIGIFPNFLSSDLGPGTIVGSAAFNLLIILAICVISIPGEEVRKIKDMGVFCITAFFSVFAYIWLLFILLIFSPNVVQVWEGVLTFVFFFIFVFLAFLADKGKLPGTRKDSDTGLVVSPESSKSERAQMECEVRKKYGGAGNLTAEQVVTLIDYDYGQGVTRAAHRRQATRSLFGGKKVLQDETNFAKGEKLSKALKSSLDLRDTQTVDLPLPEVSFKALNYTVLESVGKVEISVKCLGDPKKPFKVEYSTRDGSAVAGDDYTQNEGNLDFGPGNYEQSIWVEIIHTEGFELTEQFYVDLLEPHEKEKGVFCLGNCKTVTVVIIDEDLPGKIVFAEEVKEVKASDKELVVPVEVKRLKGCSGKVTCNFFTESDTAKEGADFERAEGVLEFEAGQENQCIDLRILADQPGRYEGTEKFRLILTKPTGGATFDETTDGGRDSAVQTIIIQDGRRQTRIDKLTNLVNWDSVHIGNQDWKEQFVHAVYCLGCREEQKEAKASDWVVHLIAVPWKLFFACVPPTEYCGGWLCFFCALGMIGFVTCIISDMAEMLGCCLAIRPAVTAITFVACGTSLPDTFASRTAAQMEPFADNSIGNVTGSNSVNVFLGLGLPWMISALYWSFVATCVPGDKWSLEFPAAARQYPSGVFVVQAGSLAVTVTAFCCCAVVCIAILMLRRFYVGGELGGSKVGSWLTASTMAGLWICYLVVSIVLAE